MSLNTTTTPIDLTTWSRREYFYYFTKMMPTGFTVNVDLDITATQDWLRKHDYKFNPTYLYLVSKVMARFPEFRIGRENDQLVRYEVLHPSYTIFHEDDHTISNLWTAYDPDFATFYQNYLDDISTYGNQHTPAPKQSQSANLYMIGSLPWTNFTSYVPLPFTPLQTFFPIIQAGKFTEHADNWTMPLSVTIHHAVADGYHVSQLLAMIQTAFHDPTEWLGA
ncbi:chloramphenicol acetyltransferase [Levilactobacillus fujinensis]|uniref:Chloramphenicol acetyltransferase n=1 Tax=Levilactobacillus fujinensis TaxID=2486024 RepID=A0ABW1TG51_9LACO|nr:chloramphenicol acetyltransferase [Levilactobacillus fujinensis]